MEFCSLQQETKVLCLCEQVYALLDRETKPRSLSWIDIKLQCDRRAVKQAVLCLLAQERIWIAEKESLNLHSDKHIIDLFAVKK